MSDLGPLSYSEAQREARKVGCTLVRKDGEFRVNFKDGAEATAAYETDLESAVGTARAMAKAQQELTNG